MSVLTCTSNVVHTLSLAILVSFSLSIRLIQYVFSLFSLPAVYSFFLLNPSIFSLFPILSLIVFFAMILRFHSFLSSEPTFRNTKCQKSVGPSTYGGHIVRRN